MLARMRAEVGRLRLPFEVVALRELAPRYRVHSITMDSAPIQIEVLFFEGCPNPPRAVELAHEVVAAMGVEARIVERTVKDGEDAVRHRFPGSPTIRVEGVDVEPQANTLAAPVFGCRLYGREGVPPRELIERAIRGQLP